MGSDRYRLRDDQDIASPQLIFYEDIIRENTRKAIVIAGGAHRLWPHVKTHKIREMLRMQMDMGIVRFKCATLAELAMVLSAGASHALLAYPLYGPNIARFLALRQTYPASMVYALADAGEGVAALSQACVRAGVRMPMFADVNMGMNRTGVPLDQLADFCRGIAAAPGLVFEGFHAYDGHNNQADLTERCAAVKPALERLYAVRDELAISSVPVLSIILGGSPTFPCYAGEPSAFLSPGTVFVWDAGYAAKCPDLPFEPAAALITRVISHPAPGLFTLDLGYKAIASDPKGARGVIPALPQTEAVVQSEEHWVWRVPDGHERPALGETVYVLPSHICPTTALHKRVLVANGGQVTGSWIVAARDRD